MLESELRRGRVIAFIGAGVALASTRDDPVARWRGLLADGVDHCEALYAGSLPCGWAESQRLALCSDDSTRLIQVGEAVSQQLDWPNGGTWKAWLARTVGQFSPASYEATKLISSKASLGTPIVTTNYDTLVEAVTGRDAVSWMDGSRLPAIARRDDDAILHLHGHWRAPESVFLGTSSYRAIVGDDFIQSLERVFAIYDSFLFVGVGAGFNDPDLGALRNWRAATLTDAPYSDYVLVRRPSCARSGARINVGSDSNQWYSAPTFATSMTS